MPVKKLPFHPLSSPLDLGTQTLVLTEISGVSGPFSTFFLTFYHLSYIKKSFLHNEFCLLQNDPDSKFSLYLNQGTGYSHDI